MGAQLQQDWRKSTIVMPSLSIEQSAAPEPVQLSGDALGGVDQLVGFCVGPRQQAERSAAAEAGLATA